MLNWLDKHPRYILVLGILFIILINHPFEIIKGYKKVVGTPTYHKVTKFRFADKNQTNLTYLNPDTKRAERVWFWWWLNPPQYYDAPEGAEYVEWTQNNLFYTDIKIHRAPSAWGTSSP